MGFQNWNSRESTFQLMGLTANSQGTFRDCFQGDRWREKIVLCENVGGSEDNMQLQSIVFSTTGYVRSSSPYQPHVVPISLTLPKVTKDKAKQSITANFRTESMCGSHSQPERQ